MIEEMPILQKFLKQRKSKKNIDYEKQQKEKPLTMSKIKSSYEKYLNYDKKKDESYLRQNTLSTLYLSYFPSFLYILFILSHFFPSFFFFVK